MDPRRKKIYYILIAVCLVLSAGILGWSYFGSSGPAVDFGPTTNTNTGPLAASGNASDGFKPPSVFPATNDFNNEVLESATFLKLNTYQKVDVTGQLGRTDPFRNY